MPALKAAAVAPAPEIAAEPPPVPPVVIHPRTVVAAGYSTGRVIIFRPADALREAASGPTPGPYTAQILEMPTPPLIERPVWRMPLLWRLLLVVAIAAFGGALAVAMLGIERETVVAIVSCVLIAAGLAQMASVIVERVQSNRAPRPAASPAAERAPRRPAAAEILRVRTVPRLPRGISDSRQSAP
jgi:hypothetical protein